MIKKYASMLFNDCRVMYIPNVGPIYLIFKNGSSSVKSHCNKKGYEGYRNEELKRFSEILIFLRDPIERCVSGIHTFLETEKIENVDITLENIESGRQHNRHFVPQLVWLFHLYKFYRRDVYFRPIDELYNIIPSRKKPFIKELSDSRREKILSYDLKDYVKDDQILIEKFMNKRVKLQNVLKEFRYALS